MNFTQQPLEATRLLGKGEAVKAVLQKQNLGSHSHLLAVLLSLEITSAAPRLSGRFSELETDSEGGALGRLLGGRSRVQEKEDEQSLCCLRWDAEKRKSKEAGTRRLGICEAKGTAG